MADDVEARVRVAEEELNLLKNQVQQTLLDVREHILDLVEPGTGIPQGDRPVANADTTETTSETVASAPASLPETQLGAGPSDLGADTGLGEMPGLDLGADTGLGAMPGLDMGGDAGLGEMPGLDMGGDAMPDGGDFPAMDGMNGFDDPGGAPAAPAAPGLDAAAYDDPGAYQGGPGPGDYQDAGAYQGGPEQGGYQDPGANQAGPGPGGYQDPGANQGGPEQRGYPDGPGPAPDAAPGAFDQYEAASPAPAAAVESEGAVTPEAAADGGTEAPSISSLPEMTLPAMPEMDLVTLVGVVRWTDQAVQSIGQTRVDALLDVWQMTGRITEPMKAMIQRICALTNEDPEERVPLRDLVAMMVQMEAVLDTEPSTNSRLLAMLFDDAADPLSGLGALGLR